MYFLVISIGIHDNIYGCANTNKWLLTYCSSGKPKQMHQQAKFHAGSPLVLKTMLKLVWIPLANPIEEDLLEFKLLGSKILLLDHVLLQKLGNVRGKVWPHINKNVTNDDKVMLLQS